MPASFRAVSELPGDDRPLQQDPPGNGIAAPEAIVEAVRHRFRAIFLTTATTALGLTPMLFETDTQAQFLIPMAVSLATGVLFASVMILFVVPALTMIVAGRERREEAIHPGATAELPTR